MCLFLSDFILGPKKGTMDPLDASLGDIEPDDADLDFLLDSCALWFTTLGVYAHNRSSDKTTKAHPKKRRSSRLKEKIETPSPRMPPCLFMLI